jgi:hypothetical protein
MTTKPLIPPRDWKHFLELLLVLSWPSEEDWWHKKTVRTVKGLRRLKRRLVRLTEQRG